ncbi:MAG: deoxyribonuclease IV [Candidatus Cloacimonetes bacterium]|nr:deoxyribonuclease IV [Candidatus Cloacimonadota bacterium]MBL7086542.1 deoxyribonuclease IV [Candidatus Cloacimonadota bacterium]
MNLGAHISIAGGVYNIFERARGITAKSIQIFTKSNNRWFSKPYNAKDIEKFHNLKEKYNPFAVFAHVAYLINLCSPNHETEKRSIDALIDEIKRCEQLNLPYLVMHPGSHLGKGKKWGLNKIVENLNYVISQNPDCKVMLLMETTAGQGTNLGYSFEQLKYILEKVKRKEKFGVCIDTCHIFAAGYDISTKSAYEKTMNKFNKIIGLKKIKVFHLNDSKHPLNSRKDRHQHIGKGEIGLDAFRCLMNDKRFSEIPMVLETPKDDLKNMDIENLKVLRSLIR